MSVLTRRLGRSNLQISALGLGCWAIGGAMAAGDQPLGYASVDDAEAVRALHRAVELDVTLFDTADAYGAGYVRRALGGSLRRLGRDRVDLYQLYTSDVSRGRGAAGRPGGPGRRGPDRLVRVSTDDPPSPRCSPTARTARPCSCNSNCWTTTRPYWRFATAMTWPRCAGRRWPWACSAAATAPPAPCPPTTSAAGNPSGRAGSPTAGPTPTFSAHRHHPRPAHRRRPNARQGALGWIWAHQRTIPLPGFRNTTQVEENLGALRHEPLSPAQHAAVEHTLDREPQLTAFTSEDGRG